MTHDEMLEENETTIETLFRLINYMGNEKELAATISDKLRRLHRTNQQSFIGVLKTVIETYAHTEGSDLRNQDSKEWARRVLALDAPGFSYI